MPTDPTMRTLRRAYELAHSGGYVTALAVEKALISEGYADAPVVLFGRTVRNALTRTCRKAAGLPELQMGRRHRNEPESRA